MDTELLKTFLEVSRTRHFGRAAESLYLTQSAVSFRIRQLENQLGANLFTRHRNNIRLTPAGERLLPYAETLMGTWQLAKKEVAHSLQHTELSIGATASLWEAYLTPWLQQLYKQREALRLEARIALRQSLVKQLHERQLDLLITTEPPKMDELASLLLGHFSLRLFSSVPFELPEKTDDESEHKNASEEISQSFSLGVAACLSHHTSFCLIAWILLGSAEEQVAESLEEFTFDRCLWRHAQ